MSISLTGWRSKGRLGKIVLLVICFSFMMANVSSADLFLKFDGIKGESTDKDHEDWSNIENVSWGVSASQGSGGGGGVGKLVFDNLSWVQIIDKSVPALFDEMFLGKSIKNATIDFTTIGSEPYTYFQMFFEDVFLTKLKVAGHSSSKASLAGDFSYDKITMIYTYQDEKGKLTSTPPVSYNLKTSAGSVGTLSYLYGLGISGPTTIPSAPVPASLLLLGSGLVGLIGWRRAFKL